MAPFRPRASDFDDPPSRTSPVHHHRPSPTYEPPSQLHHRQRLTPEESLDRHHHSRENNNSYRNNNGYRQGGRDDFFEKRRIERENVTVGFWPKSPGRPYGEEKKRHHSSHKEDRHHERSKAKKKSRHEKSEGKSKKHDHSDDESESDRSDERHHKSRKKHKSHGRHRGRDYDSYSDQDDDHDKKVKERGRREKSKSNNPVEAEEDIWMEKEVTTTTTSVNPKKDSLSGPSLRPITVEEPAPTIDEEDVGEVGPMPYNHVTGKAMDPKEFGRALRPGEGSAMAAFIEAGERIPRRGEIGLTGVEIEKFENVGYVMSGSRHRRMNAVRIRKENQVISAEEKRGILKMQAEEKAKREGQIISSFRELVDTKLQETG